MCGITGFIGKSNNHRVSFEFANALLVKTETRGEHATGFWACERGDGRIFFDKEPIKSSIYANRDIWAKQFADADCDLLVAHCRFSSTGVGHEKYNKNNHPHVSADRRVALVHNGKIPEYSALKSRYDLRSDCDSEILLGMFESGEEFKNKEDYLKQEFPSLTPDIAYRMLGLKEIFSRVNYGAMAVAIGERNDNSRVLWLFRDDERPLHVVDMRKSLGQIFFCSTPEIWKSAVESCPSIKDYIQSDHFLIEFPPYQVWMLAIDPNPDYPAYAAKIAAGSKETEIERVQEDTWRAKKFRISKTKFYDWKQEDDDDVKAKRIKSKPVAKVVSRLDAAEEVKKESEKSTETSANNGPVPTLPGHVRECRTIVQAPAKKKAIVSQSQGGSLANSSGLANVDKEDDVNDTKDLTEITSTEPEIDMEDFEKLTGDLRSLLADIESKIKSLREENKLTPKDFSIVLESLGDAKNELKGSLLFLK